jgi:ABC-type branched-subunit amino acid transport system substrate-binding protein
MPIATSPDAVLVPPGRSDSGRPLENCFRLPPSDTIAQAPAVVFVAQSLVKGMRCTVMHDTSQDATTYSGPLFKEVVRLLDPSRVQDTIAVSRQESSILALMSNTALAGPDCIVFCGYGTTATQIFEAARQAYAFIAFADRPTFILTDGCHIPDLDTSGFSVYLTLPFPGSSEIALNPDSVVLRDLLMNLGQDYSYAIYGYDAMLVLGRALTECDNGASRRDLLRSLRQLEHVNGAFLNYSFNNGECLLRRYYLYHSPLSDQKPASDFKYVRKITDEEIASVYR